LAIFEGEDAAIADGHAKDVRSEVFEGGLAGAYGLRVNDLSLAPEPLVKELEELGLFEQVSEFGAEQDCSCSDQMTVRHEVAIPTVILGFQEITLRSAVSTLPRHASPATAGCEALGTI
jgi:hypothetical protein